MFGGIPGRSDGILGTIYLPTQHSVECNRIAGVPRTQQKIADEIKKADKK